MEMSQEKTIIKRAQASDSGPAPGLFKALWKPVERFVKQIQLPTPE